MAKKLIDHDEAARMLGVSSDELNSMRDRKQVFPKRDAGVWKYEQEQIQKLVEERKSGGGDSWDQSLDLDDLSLDTDSIVLAEDAPKQGQSTVIGKKKHAESGSDVRLVSESTVMPSKPVGDGSGRHIFSATLAEHNAAVARYLVTRRETLRKAESP